MSAKVDLDLKPTFESIFKNTFKLWGNSLPFVLAGSFFTALASIGLSSFYFGLMLKYAGQAANFNFAIPPAYTVIVDKLFSNQIWGLVFVLSLLVSWMVDTYFNVGLFNSLNAGDVPRPKYLKGFWGYLARNIVYTVLYVFFIFFLPWLFIIVYTSIYRLLVNVFVDQTVLVVIIAIIFIIFFLVSVYFYLKLLLQLFIAKILFMFDIKGFFNALKESIKLTKGHLWMILGLFLVFMGFGSLIEQFSIKINFYLYFFVLLLVAGLLYYYKFMTYYALRNVNAQEVEVQEENYPEIETEI